MKIFLKLSFVFVVTLTFISCGNENDSKAAGNGRDYLLVKFYASWCATCQAWKKKPGFSELKERVEAMGVRVAVFDFSDEKGKAASAELAQKLGIEDIYDTFAPRMGFALLINIKAKKRVFAAVMPLKQSPQEQFDIVKKTVETNVPSKQNIDELAMNDEC